MSGSQQPAERSDLLSQALDLCNNLCDILERLGPSRFTQSDDVAVSKVHELESALHRRLQQVSQKCNSALSAVSRLSDDILRLIIQHGYDDEIMDYYPRFPVRTFARVIFCISRRWRAIAIDMGNVWTDLVFSKPSKPRYLGDEDSKPIHPWYGSSRALNDMSTCNLERSKQSLLNVKLNITQLRDSRRMINEYLHVCNNRVADLALRASTSSGEDMKAIVQCVTQTRETLRRLQILIRQPTTDEGGRETIESLLLCNLPRLVEVQLYALPLPLVHRPEYAAFLRCRHIHLELNPQIQYSPSHLIALLKCAPQLQGLYLVTYRQHQDQAGAEPEFHLPRMPLPELRSLTFKSMCIGRHTLGRLTAPKIESPFLSVISPSDAHDKQNAYVDDLLDFITASSGSDSAPPPIKTLSVEGGIMHSLHRIVRIIPGLEVLQIVSDPLWSVVEEEERGAFLNELAAQSFSPTGDVTFVDGVPCPVLCPNLQTLQSLAWPKPSHIRLLTTLASRRRSAGMPLTRIRRADWPLQNVSPETIGMSATPSEQYALEKALAREAEILECGKFRWEWKDGGRWQKMPSIGHRNRSPYLDGP